MNPIKNDLIIDFLKFNPKNVKKITLRSLSKNKYFNDNDGYVLYNFFSPEECDSIIEKTEKIGYRDLYGYSKNYRNNKRIIVNSSCIIGEMQSRISNFIDNQLLIDDNCETLIKIPINNGTWKFSYLNPYLRLCKYNKCNKFEKHIDSGYNPNIYNERTFKTCMVYLNDKFLGGSTRFYDYNNNIILELKPKKGMCLVFNQNILHDGQIILEGKKYIMRTDMIYKPISLNRNITEDEEKGLDLYKKGQKIEKRWLKSKKREDIKEAIKYYNDAKKLCPFAEYIV